MRQNKAVAFIRSFGRKCGILPNGRQSQSQPERGAAWYDDLYSTSPDAHYRYSQSFYYFLWTVIVDRLRRTGIGRVLEIGCGTGQLAGFLLDQGVKQYFGLDFSPTAIAIARQNVPGGRFLVGDARLPDVYQQVEHEAVICTEVLEHIEADLVVVSNFRPGKRCLCSVPNFPYASHVRHFKDARGIVNRYGPFFKELDIVAFDSPRSLEDRFFLFDGVRNDHSLSTR